MNPLRKAAVSLTNATPSAVARQFRGTGRLARLVRPVANLLLPKDLTRVTVRAGRGAGLQLLIDPHGEKYYWSGLFEAEVQEVVTSRLAAGDAMWDVGAHVGFLTAVAARAVGPTGQIVAFEPLPANCSRLKLTVSANNLTNVMIREAAVSSAVGVSEFYLDANTTMGTLAPTEGASHIGVPVTTLDNELDTFRPPTLVKIDVEGCEDEVIAGGRRLFIDVRPLLIIELLSEQRVPLTKSLLPSYRFSRIDAVNFLGEPADE